MAGGCRSVVALAGRAPLRRVACLAAAAAAACLGIAVLLHWRLPDQPDGSGVGKAPQLHFAWVTDCSPYQEWQSLVLLWTIYLHQDPLASVTRLISGCDVKERDERQRVHASVFPEAFGRGVLKLFFTDVQVYDAELNETYPPYNRPRSLERWVASNPLGPEVRVVLLDPDMVMLAPLRLPGASDADGDVLYRGRVSLAEALRLPGLGQRYRYVGARWPGAKLRLADICGGEQEGCLRLTDEEVVDFFSIGPPWIVRFSDLRRAAPLWATYAPRVRRQYRQLIAEMYAYVLAFAAVGVRHALFDHFVVSYPNAPAGEHAWQWVDEAVLAGDNPCGGSAEVLRRRRTLPTFLHYCEIYHAEDWFFQKRNVPHAEVLNCSAPLFAEPPATLLRRFAEDVRREASEWSVHAARQAWFLCALLSVLNEAVAGVRASLCAGGAFNASRTLRVPMPEGPFSKALQEFFQKTSGSDQ